LVEPGETGSEVAAVQVDVVAMPEPPTALKKIGIGGFQSGVNVMILAIFDETIGVFLKNK
jgi:hypothetical protein